MKIEDIGKRIKMARLEKEKTLKEVADDIGLTKSTIQRYESGTIENLKLPVIEAIARSIGVNPSWLLGKSDQKELTAERSLDIVDELRGGFIRIHDGIVTEYSKLSDENKKIIDKQIKFLLNEQSQG